MSGPITNTAISATSLPAGAAPATPATLGVEADLSSELRTAYEQLIAYQRIMRGGSVWHYIPEDDLSKLDDLPAFMIAGSLFQRLSHGRFFGGFFRARSRANITVGQFYERAGNFGRAIESYRRSVIPSRDTAAGEPTPESKVRAYTLIAEANEEWARRLEVSGRSEMASARWNGAADAWVEVEGEQGSHAKDARTRAAIYNLRRGKTDLRAEPNIDPARLLKLVEGTGFTGSSMSKWNEFVVASLDPAKLVFLRAELTRANCRGEQAVAVTAEVIRNKGQLAAHIGTFTEIVDDAIGLAKGQTKPDKPIGGRGRPQKKGAAKKPADIARDATRRGGR